MSLTLNLGSNGDFLVTDTSGHTLRIPADETGLSLIQTLLRKRQQFNSEPPLGSDARPVQSMIQAYLAAHAPKIAARPGVTAKQVSLYADLDLEIDL